MPLYHIPRYRNTLMIVTHPFTDGAAGLEHALRQDHRRGRARDVDDGGDRLAALRVAPDLHQLRPARAQGRERRAVDEPRGALGPLVGAHRALGREPHVGRRRLRPADGLGRPEAADQPVPRVRVPGGVRADLHQAHPVVQAQPDLRQRAVQQVVRDPVERVQPAAPVEAQEDQAAHDVRALRDGERRVRDLHAARDGGRLRGHAARRAGQPVALLHRAAGARHPQPAALPGLRDDPHRLVAQPRPLAGHVLAHLPDEDGARAAARLGARPPQAGRRGAARRRSARAGADAAAARSARGTGARRRDRPQRPGHLPGDGERAAATAAAAAVATVCRGAGTRTRCP